MCLGRSVQMKIWRIRQFYSILFGISRFTTEEEIDYTARETIKHVKALRSMSPLWEIFQEGVGKYDWLFC
jgi:hypothetical protein